MLHLPFLFLLVVPGLLVHAVTTLKYITTNQCPQAITVFINGQSQGSLAANGGSIQRTFDNFDGFIFTDANGGNKNGTGTTRAGFFGDTANYYYVVVDPNHFNTGVQITPNGGVPKEGFCPTAVCTSLTCIYAFQQPPTAFPPPTNIAPKLPLSECPSPFIKSYTITFCPDGTFPPPPETGRALHPNGNPNKCLDVRGAVFANGTPVQIFDCNETKAQKWIINRANTKVRVAGTNFCLDAGTHPASGIGMKIWQCFDNLPAQAWFYTNDNRIAVTGQGQCLDLTNGLLTNSNRVQTWQCTDHNTNQIWTL